MAKDYHFKQSSKEELVYPIDWTDALLTGVTVTALTYYHTPPSGSAVIPTSSIASPITYTYMPSGLVVGLHYVNVVATTSDSKLSPEVRLLIRVDY